MQRLLGKRLGHSERDKSCLRGKNQTSVQSSDVCAQPLEKFMTSDSIGCFLLTDFDWVHFQPSEVWLRKGKQTTDKANRRAQGHRHRRTVCLWAETSTETSAGRLSSLESLQALSLAKRGRSSRTRMKGDVPVSLETGATRRSTTRRACTGSSLGQARVLVCELYLTFRDCCERGHKHVRRVPGDDRCWCVGVTLCWWGDRQLRQRRLRAVRGVS